MKKITLGLFLISVCLFAGYFLLSTKSNTNVEESPVIENVSPDSGKPALYTERYSARVDRVDVVFEHADYTSYRLTTNGLVREGELNTERGYKEDPDATVYVLNWQQPEGEQIRYVRLTEEPGKLYVLDGNSDIISGSPLILEQGQ